MDNQKLIHQHIISETVGKLMQTSKMAYLGNYKFCGKSILGQSTLFTWFPYNLSHLKFSLQ